MKLHFTQLDLFITFSGEYVSVFQIENKVLFSKIIYSFLTQVSETYQEPFVFTVNDEEVSTKDRFALVTDIVALPFQTRQTETRLHALFGELLHEDENLRSDIELLNQKMEERLAALGLQLHADYSFKIEWDTKKYLKAFDFSIENESETLFDNLIVFLKSFSDLSPGKVLIFVNLKSFFDKKHLERLYLEIISLNLPVLLLESVLDTWVFEAESKTTIDQHFLKEQ